MISLYFTLFATLVSGANVFPWVNRPVTNSSSSTLFNAKSPPFFPSPWLSPMDDEWRAAILKAQNFVSQLSLLERVNLTTGVGWMGGPCVGNTGSISRLGFDGLCMQDGPLGIRMADFVTAFPSAGTITASWDPLVWIDQGEALGREFRLKGVDVMLGPVVGPIGRIPVGGRNWEGFGTDPYLAGIAVGKTVTGIQNSGVIACTKHLIGNEQERYRQAGEVPAGADHEDVNQSLSSNVEDKTLHEVYLWPFADAVKAGTGAIMCSYNQLNNTYACENSHLLNGLLKSELGFQGFVMSDWQAQHSGVVSALSGLDMSMPGDGKMGSGWSYWGGNLTVSVLNGTVPQWRIDDMAARIMAAYYFVNRPDNRVPTNFNSWTLDTTGKIHPQDPDSGTAEVNSHFDVRGEHAALARRHAARSTVLLKNEGVLPLTGEELFVGIFGEDAGSSPQGPNGCADRGCDSGTLAMGWGSGTADFPYLVTPESAIQAEVLRHGHIVQSVTDAGATSQISNLARRASVCLAFVNADAGEGFINVDGNYGDRKNLTLWQRGDELIKQVTAECNNTVVIVHSVGPVILRPYRANPNVTAIIWAGLPGQESGNAIVDTLYGKEPPAGKLPFTIARRASDYGPGSNLLEEPNNGRDAPQQLLDGMIDYRWFDRMGIEPEFEFGYGLTYTTFEYGEIQALVPEGGIEQVQPHGGISDPAPALTHIPLGFSDAYKFPEGFKKIAKFIYSFVTAFPTQPVSPSLVGPDGVLPPSSQLGEPQRVVPSGGGSGGNPSLWDVVMTVTVPLKNIGSRAGEEVAQLYLTHVDDDGKGTPVKVLRGFERVKLEPREEITVVFTLRRRDLCVWDTGKQMWQIPNNKLKAWVGGSSRSVKMIEFGPVLAPGPSSVSTSATGTRTGTGGVMQKFKVGGERVKL